MYSGKSLGLARMGMHTPEGMRSTRQTPASLSEGRDPLPVFRQGAEMYTPRRLVQLQYYSSVATVPFIFRVHTGADPCGLGSNTLVLMSKYKYCTKTRTLIFEQLPVDLKYQEY